MQRISTALNNFFKANKIRQEQIATRLGCSQAYVSSFLSGKRKFSRKTAEKWGEVFGLNPTWLLTGSGEMFSDSPCGEVSKVYDGQMEFVMENSNGARFYQADNHLLMTVKLVPFDAYARFIDPNENIEAEREEWEDVTFEVPNVVHGKYFAFKVKGDSMDNGMRDSFEEGDLILVRSLDRQYWLDRVRFNEHPYWVVVTHSSVLLKQMVAQDIENGSFTFHSLNPSEEYADFSVPMDEINLLFYVLKKKAKEISY